MQPKIVISGDAKVGKTALAKAMKYGQDYGPAPYKPTKEKKVYTITFGGDKGGREILLYDLAGQKDLVGLRPGYFMDANMVIILVGPEPAKKDIIGFVNEARQCAPNAYVACGAIPSLFDDPIIIPGLGELGANEPNGYIININLNNIGKFIKICDGIVKA